MLCLTIDPHSEAILYTSDGPIRVVNNDAIKQRLGFDAPKSVKILRGELVERPDPRRPHAA